MAKHSRRHIRRSGGRDKPVAGEALAAWPVQPDTETAEAEDASGPALGPLHTTEPGGTGGGSAGDWFGPSQPGEEEYAPRKDVPLASMLMLGENPWQRIDGMGMARQALEAAPTSDGRHDLTDDERFLLANGRAWCLAVHADLAHQGRRDDPFVLADIGRHLEEAEAIAPGNPQLHTTWALLRLRQGRTDEGLECARRAVQTFGSMPDHERSGRTQGAAILALVTLALVTAASGDLATARLLGGAARAVWTPLDIDEAAYTSLMAELSERLHTA